MCMSVVARSRGAARCPRIPPLSPLFRPSLLRVDMFAPTLPRSGALVTAHYFLLVTLVLWTTGIRCEVDTVSANDCSQESLITCAYPSKVDKLKFASKKEDLDSLCFDLHKGLRCIDDYTRRCLPPQKRSHFNKLYAGSSMVIQEICEEGPYQQEFLKHAPCMQEVRQDYEVCAKNYERKIQSMNKELPGTKTKVEMVCCSLNEYLSCSKTVVEEICGEETAEFTAGFLDKMALSLMEIHCVNNKFTSTSESCSSGSRMSTTDSGYALVLLYLLTSFIHRFLRI